MRRADLRLLLNRFTTGVKSSRADIETLATNGVLTLLIVMLALAASQRLDRVREGSRRVQGVHEALKTWPSHYQPPSEFERQSWSAAAADVERLGIKQEERLFLAQLISRRAENVGIGDARIRFTQAVGGEARRVGGREFKPAAYGAAVEFESSFASGVEFVAQLPAAVEIASLSMQRSTEGVKLSFMLQVFEPAGASR